MSDSHDKNDASGDSPLLVEVPSSADMETRESVYFDSKQVDVDEDALDEEEEEAHRLRMDGTTDFLGEPQRRSSSRQRKVGPVRKLSQRLSQQLLRRRSSIRESLPETPAGWTILLSAVLTSGLGYELRLQKSLTQPPYTFGQLQAGSLMADIYQKLTASPDCILSRPIQPSLFVGTRGMVSSAAAYLLGGPSSSQEHLRFREIVQSTIDGASFGVDWEVPWKTDDRRTSSLTYQERRNEILKGPIQEPVVIILHGINNDANFGYMRSLQRAFADRGWNAAAVNFRGCGGVPMTTPRAYNASYTGDVRCLVWILSGRLAKDVPVFLVGNSMGASVMSKYLGEEGMSGTLPKCVSGAASLGSPLMMNSTLMRFPFNVILALGVKKTFFQNWSTMTKMREPMYQAAFGKAMLSSTLAKLDDAVAPVLARNDPFYPFAFRIGFKDGLAYSLDSSSFRLLRFISVPFLNLNAEDDFLIAASTRSKLGFCVSNPNIMVAQTRCGGHLGWQESPIESAFGRATSWADAAVADFFDALMKTNQERSGSPVSPHTSQGGTLDELEVTSTTAARDALRSKAENFTATKLKSRL